MTHAITYLSKAVSGIGPADVQDIWTCSIENNELRELTGALYFSGEFFLQVIEGEEEDVEWLYRKIAKDNRHEDIVEIARNDLAAPMFRELPMKFIDGSHAPHLQQKFEYEKLVSGGPSAANKAGFQLLRL